MSTEGADGSSAVLASLTLRLSVEVASVAQSCGELFCRIPDVFIFVIGEGVQVRQCGASCGTDCCPSANTGTSGFRPTRHVAVL